MFVSRHGNTQWAVPTSDNTIAVAEFLGWFNNVPEKKVSSNATKEDMFRTDLKASYIKYNDNLGVAILG